MAFVSIQEHDSGLPRIAVRYLYGSNRPSCRHPSPPAQERARVALELIRSLDGSADADAAQTWDVEIERRGDEVDADAAETITLDEYRARIRQRRAARANR